MQHRNLNTTEWTHTAIESLFERGTLADWREFNRAMRDDRILAVRALEVSAYREADGSEGIARAFINQLYPDLIQPESLGSLTPLSQVSAPVGGRKKP
ncbi:MAG: hypothetical protein EBZ48_01955 [Proteobacteria bacterium]|nr:hypothetical protein [Pseudomonadota bacterium]